MCLQDASKEMTLANILLPKTVIQPQDVNLRWERSTSYAEEYKSAFQAVDKQVMMPALHEKLLRAGITINEDFPSHNRLKDYSVKLQRVERGGALMTYHVSIGPYQINVVMLNIQERVQSLKRKVVSKGTFGNVIQVVTERQCFVAKRIYFRSGQRVLKHFSDGMEWQIPGNADELSHILQEFAFFKLCSALEIGARAIPSIFDVVCYQDAVQYYMQKCQILNLAPSHMQKFEMRMMYCLKVLHTLNLVHKDIKPPNIMYNTQTKEFVLVDFGVSSYVEKPIGSCTHTFRQGTFRYMSPEMRRIPTGCTGTIDLYYNDLYGLRLVIDELTRKSKLSGNVWPAAAKRPEPIEEDVMLSALYSRLKGVKYTQSPLWKNSPLLKALLPFFSDLLTSDNSPPPQLQPEFLIRAIGIKTQLLSHLNKMPCHDIRIKLLIQKLLLHSSNLNQNLLENLMKVEYHQHYLQQLERNLLAMEKDPGKDQPENVSDRFIMLSKIALCYSQKDEWVAYIECLKRASKLLRLLGQTLKARYLDWMRQLMEGQEDRIPDRTEESGIFSCTLLDWQYHLLTSCLVLCFQRKRYKSAYYISVILMGKLPSITPSNDLLRQQLLANLESIRASTTGLRCVVLTLIYLDQMASLGRFGKLIELCSALTAQVKQLDYHFALTYSQLLARRSLGDVTGALYCTERAIRLSSHVDFPVKPQYIQLILTLKAQLQSVSGQYQKAIITNMEIKRMLKDSTEQFMEENLRTNHNIFLSLSKLQRFEEAKFIMEDTVRILLLIEPHDSRLPEMLENFTGMLYQSALRGEFRFLVHISELTSRITQFIPNSLLQQSRQIESLVWLYGIHQLTIDHEASLKTIISVLSLIADYYLREQLTLMPNQQQISAMVGNFITSPLIIFELHSSSLKKNTTNSQKTLLYNNYITLLYYFLFNNSPQQAITLANAYYQSKQFYSGWHITYLLSWCIQHQYYDVVIALTTTHKAVPQQDSQFCRGYSLYKLDRHQEAVVLLKFFLENCNNRRRERVKVLLALSDIATNVHFMLEEPHIYVEQAKLILVDLLAKRPEKPQLWLSMGICEVKLQKYNIALQWLEKVQCSKVPDLMKECSLLYGVSLNKLKQHKRAVYYLRRGQGLVGLFYLSHSLFVLRRKFKKPTSKLLAADVKGQYNGYLMEFIAKYSPSDYLVIFQTAATPEQEDLVKKLFEQPHFRSKATGQATKLIALRKRLARFLMAVRSHIMRIGKWSVSESQRVAAINQKLRQLSL